MKLTELITDPYNRRARLQPALLTLLPVVLIALILFPALETTATTIFGIIAYFGGAAYLTQHGRERGKQLEAKLYQDWGGMPSVALLRHRDDVISPQTKARYHTLLGDSIPHLRMPDPEQEDGDPDTADNTYRSATDWLLANTRDKEKFRLVFEENMNYGFRRNLWALRPIAVTLDILLLAGVILLRLPTSTDISAIVGGINEPVLLAMGVAVVHLVLMLGTTKRWVRTAANEYARQLLAACDTLRTIDGHTRS